MAYKDILVHLDASPRSQARMKLAAEMAAEHKAHLTGLFAIEILPSTLLTGDPGLFDIRLADEMLEQMRERGKAAAQKVEKDFLAALRKYDIRGEWRVVEMTAADAVSLHARYADIVVVGQTDSDAPTRQEGPRIPEAAIMSCGRPVLVVPYIGAPKTFGRNILVGWKSGREAARAVNDAIPLLRNARSVTVLAVDPEYGFSGDGDVPAADIALHLARHDIKATASHTPSGGVDEGDVLLNTASDQGTDLIVVGGYGRSRANEFVFGGVTRTLLKEMTVPVLFSH